MAKDKLVTRPPKGTRDFLPIDIRRRDYVTSVIRGVYEAHGFEPLETPSYERLDTLLGKYGDEGDQLVFKIQSRGQAFVTALRTAAAELNAGHEIVSGRSGETAPALETQMADFGLRYDLTVPLARVMAEYQGKLPAVFKRYQIQPVWRADKPGKGRFREFYQCDVDVCGSESLLVEAEVAGAVAQAIRKLGFTSFDIRLNHRALLRALIDTSGIAQTLESAAIIAIDKLDKLKPEAVQAELEAKGIDADAALRLLDLVSGQPALDQIAKRLENHEAGTDAVTALRRVLELAAATPASGHLRFDVSLARGLGYYTGSIFEIAVPDLAGSLGGGGRYDGLIGMFSGRDVPACGFSIGLERILVVMEQRDMFPDALSGLDVSLAAAHKSQLDAALALAYRLREAGLKVQLAPKPEKPAKLRKSADERGVAHAIWLQDDAGSAHVWTRASGETTVVGIDALAASLSRRPS